MTSVDERDRQSGYPEVTSGIGINTGEVVANNIGSQKRIKYAVVGRVVNLTASVDIIPFSVFRFPLKDC